MTLLERYMIIDFIGALSKLVELKTGVNPMEAGFSNEVFTIRPYYWGSDGEKEADKPNFEYAWSGNDKFEVCWYKHLGRGTEINTKLEFQEARNMFTACLNSL